MNKILFCLTLIYSILLNYPTFSLTETQKLESLARVWGFLKYYHPTVASGKLDWDKELFIYFPKVRSASSKEELNQIYLNWIKELCKIESQVPENKLSINNKSFNKNFDLSWKNDSLIFSAELTKKLSFIENNRLQGINYYATPNALGIIEITNENVYPHIHKTPLEEEYRILCLFRYWNIIEYFYPYKYLTDQSWNEVITEMIPKFLNVKTESEYHLVLQELIAKVDDNHAQIYEPYETETFGRFYIPAAFKIIDNKAIITEYHHDSLAKADDIRVGDVIYKVNGEDIKDIIKRKSKYISAANEATKIRNFREVIFNGLTNSVKLTFEKDGILKEKEVKRYPFYRFENTKSKDGDKWIFLKNNIGYVNLGNINLEEVSEMIKFLLKCEKVILDIRNYPRFDVEEISKHLNSEPRTFAKVTLPDPNYPGKFYWKEGFQVGEFNKNSYKGKVVILINEETQSAAEFTVMSLQTADNVTLIGSHTAGSDGNAIVFDLIGGATTRISAVGVYYPDGKETQRVGILPDIEIRPTLLGIKNGIDEVLERAIDYLMSSN